MEIWIFEKWIAPSENKATFRLLPWRWRIFFWQNWFRFASPVADGCHFDGYNVVTAWYQCHQWLSWDSHNVFLVVMKRGTKYASCFFSKLSWYTCGVSRETQFYGTVFLELAEQSALITLLHKFVNFGPEWNVYFRFLWFYVLRLFCPHWWKKSKFQTYLLTKKYLL